jgi:hypothetical protein
MKKIKILIFLFVLITTIHTVNALGFGVSPSTIKISNAFKGQAYERIIGIFNSESNTSIFVLNVTGNGNEWISFYEEDNPTKPITNVSIPGNGNARVIVKFTISQDASNGDYSPIIYVSVVPENKTSEGSVSWLNIQIPIQTSITVTGEQVLTGKVNSITIEDTEINHPIIIKIEFQNTGNVIATPIVKTTILKNNLVIDEFTHSDKSFPINSAGIIELKWNTIGQTVGDYVADVKVFLDENLISEKNLALKILERGTLTAQGKILNVNIPTEIDLGQIIKIEVQFQNTGEIDIRAKINGEIYSNNQLINVINGDETLIGIDKKETLVAYFKPESPGDYLIKGKVLYEGKSVNMDTISIKVKYPETTTTTIVESTEIPTGQFISITPETPIFIFLLIIVSAVIGILIKKFTH